VFESGMQGTPIKPPSKPDQSFTGLQNRSYRPMCHALALLLSQPTTAKQSTTKPAATSTHSPKRRASSKDAAPIPSTRKASPPPWTYRVSTRDRGRSSTTPNRCLMAPICAMAVRSLWMGADTMAAIFYVGNEGARAYYMHAVLHDWSDETSVKILKQVAAVMKPGYSKILINDIVIPATGTSYIQAGLDCPVLQASATERTEAMWKKVIKEAGLRLVKIGTDGRNYESIIEAELP
ncbi:MAG: hypothetical protein Q9188_007505, partial [Gyalolechia gomerana]